MKEQHLIAPGKDKVNPPEYLPGLRLKEQHTSKSFFTYWHKENYVYNYLLLGIFVIEFLVFKIFYPYPDFFSDSYSYIYAAYKHFDVNIWPIGYSKFLLLFHSFSHSALALNFFQFMCLEIAALYFFHTITYFFPTGKTTRTLLSIFLFFNPMWLYLANYVTSDSLFVALSLIWLTQIVWIVQRPHWSQIPVQAIIFAIAFTFRYNAMIYPVIGAVAFISSKHTVMMKIAGCLLGPALMALFIMFSRDASFRMLGSRQFPPILGGWQWGNNALYIRQYVDMDSTGFPNPETSELDRIARTYFREVPPQYRDLSAYVANFFIRQPEAPLKTYLRAHYSMMTGKENVLAWGKAAPVFGEYGLHVIKQHPWAFADHFMLMNSKNYFLPPLEKLEIYNLGMDSVESIASFWFNFPSEKITVVASKSLMGYILFIYPCLFLIVNLYFFAQLIGYLRYKLFRKAGIQFNVSLGIMTVFIFLNFLFSISANIIVIRYQVFPMVVCLGAALLLMDARELYLPQKAQPSLSKSLSPTDNQLHPTI